MKKDRNGFTLVEIIVSVAIASVVLMIAGSMIVSSFKFMFSTTDTDINKRTVDSLINFIRSDIEYSYDVRLMKPTDENAPNINEDSDWHCYYVKNGYLYRDEKQIFNNEYYNGNQLKILSKGNYQNGIRVDFTYQLFNEKEKKYSSRDTIMFLNVTLSNEITNQGLYTDSDVEITENGYWLFFNTKLKPTNIDVDENYNNLEGTISDIKFNINGLNYRGIYNSKDTYQYAYGEIVWYNGNFWEYTLDRDNGNPPGTDYAWKRLTSDYTHENIGLGTNKEISCYEAGDIVVYNNKYYQVNPNLGYKLDNPDNTRIIQNGNLNPSWNYIGNVGETEIDKYVKEIGVYNQKKVYNNQIGGNENTLMNVYLPKNIDMTDSTHLDVADYNPNKQYQINDIVKIQSTSIITDQSNVANPNYYFLYIKMANLTPGVQPGTPESGWMKIDNVYDQTSYYPAGVIVKKPKLIRNWKGIGISGDVEMLSCGDDDWIISLIEVNKFEQSQYLLEQLNNVNNDNYQRTKYWKFYR